MSQRILLELLTTESLNDLWVLHLMLLLLLLQLLMILHLQLLYILGYLHELWRLSVRWLELPPPQTYREQGGAPTPPTAGFRASGRSHRRRMGRSHAASAERARACSLGCGHWLLCRGLLIAQHDVADVDRPLLLRCWAFRPTRSACCGSSTSTWWTRSRRAFSAAS